METDTDESILIRVARGDDTACAEFYDRVAPLLFALALRLLGDENDAGQALQEGFPQLCEKAAEFKPEAGPARFWAAMVFRNGVIDRLRAARRHLRLNEIPVEDLLDLETPPGGHATGEGGRADLVRRALRSLPDEQRRSVEWAFLRGLTHLQLAELMGAPLGAVRTHIRRGLMRLRDIFNGAAS